MDEIFEFIDFVKFADEMNAPRWSVRDQNNVMELFLLSNFTKGTNRIPIIVILF